MWRLLYDSDNSDSRGLAVDDALAKCATEHRTTLRLYTYRPCVLAGRFQRINDEVHLDQCLRQNIPVNRRPSGGGAIIMGPDQLGIAFTFSPRIFPAVSRQKKLMKTCSAGIVTALRSLGVIAQFQGKNDLAVDGRKIAGLGMYASGTGGMLFHASLLVDLDLDYMLDVLKTPFQKLADKGVKSVAERVTTVNQQAGAISVSDVSRHLVVGYEEAFGTTIEIGELTSQEQQLAVKLQREKYESEDWIRQFESQGHDKVGRSRISTPGGVLEVHAIIANHVVKSVTLSGDFITTDNAVLDLESSLRWHVHDSDSLSRTIEDSIRRHQTSWEGISHDLIMDAILVAIETTPDKVPHPCFASGDMQ